MTLEILIKNVIQNVMLGAKLINVLVRVFAKFVRINTEKKHPSVQDVMFLIVTLVQIII